MVTARTVIAYIEELAGRPLNPDEGLHHGDADQPIERVCVSWMATPDALSYAGERGCDLMLVHESLYYPYDAIIRDDNPPGWQNWPTNHQRRELLDQHTMALVRGHFCVDEISILADFAALLGLGEPVASDGLVQAFEIPPCSLASLVARVKERVGMPAIRFSSPNGLDQIVHRVGLPWGGLGLFVNVDFQQKLIEQGCDVFIAGESDNYGFRFSAECGIPMIETSHEVSENPGLKRFAGMLDSRFPELEVLYYHCPQIWEMA